MRSRDAAAPASPAGRPLRRDAEMNRQRILRAAAEVFTERGLDATLDDVARHAGVGVGTVYRRFPGKMALAEALFTERINGIGALAERALQHPDPWAGLAWFLEEAGSSLAADRGLRQIMMFATFGEDRVGKARARLQPVVTRMVERAQAAGVLRPDLQPTDIPLLEFMLASVAEYAQDVRPDIWRRYLALIMDGLRSGSAISPLPEKALSPDEMAGAMRSLPGRAAWPPQPQR
ncbi:MAG TPA: helix-turn-helix domain-containing protein [Streptosporangiaceae bacterium]|nr:helix-turn-helix domain-containing protein [Streptosporangiaceae bacterium]